MRVRLIAAAVVLALAVAGCGGGGPSRRDEVSRYIEAVNVIEAKVVQPARTISQAGNELGKAKGDRAAAAAKLRRAARRIDALRVKVAAVEAPVEARRLRGFVLELMHGQAALAREVATFAEFGPSFQAALRPLGLAGTKLRAALAGKGSPAVKADALDAYAASLAATAVRLRAVHPPPVSRPAYATQVRTIGEVEAATLALARALREQRAQELPALLTRFQRAAVGNQTLAAQRAQIAAVRAYNRRVRDLADVEGKIVRERARLQRTLG